MKVLATAFAILAIAFLGVAPAHVSVTEPDASECDVSCCHSEAGSDSPTHCPCAPKCCLPGSTSVSAIPHNLHAVAVLTLPQTDFWISDPADLTSRADAPLVPPPRS